MLVFTVMLAVIIATAWILPIRYVRGLRVEHVHVVPVKTDRGPRSRRIAVTFSTPKDIAAIRRASGLGFVTADLSDCAGKMGDTREVIDQRAGYLADTGRVRRLGLRDGQYRYSVLFDDTLGRSLDNRFVGTPAIGVPGGLCFSLGGSAMWFGYLWSTTVPLDRIG